ncbi:hypothetical protein F388_04619 [Mannheimia haemolytica serotype 6 str. H23]|nr:hypothetical protein F388_04619 [Mannheimia haemolytica serotype 6 str. H23]
MKPFSRIKIKRSKQPATYAWLRIETTAATSVIGVVCTQPPTRGCELKRGTVTRADADKRPATYAWLRIENQQPLLPWCNACASHLRVAAN